MKIEHIPASSSDLAALGWKTLDVILVTGDPLVDHPSFPASLLARILLDAGYRTAVIARPDFRDPGAIAHLGCPRLFFGVTAGALDSMVANYTALKKKRSDDAYAPGGKAGGRPDRAVTAYCNLIRQAFGKQAVVVAGGIEASLRRFAHYDYWSDSVRRPLLMDCGADLLIYGMAEATILAVAKELDKVAGPEGIHGTPQRERAVHRLHQLPGLVYRQAASGALPTGAIRLPSAEEVAGNKRLHAKAFRIMETNRRKTLCQQAGGMMVVANPPPPPLTENKLDEVYGLPFSRNPHRDADPAPIPALQQVRFSITSHRGCFGGCAFCAIGHHQGSQVQSRSPNSVRQEAQRIAGHPDFRGTIPDVGGPSANMYRLDCEAQTRCNRVSCLHPSLCKELGTDHSEYMSLLKDVASTPGVKHAFVTTGVRMELALTCPPFVLQLARDHTSGHLKIAPEHVAQNVLDLMRKPAGSAFQQFLSLHSKATRGDRRRQFVVPYLMAAHPGCDLGDMVDLALYLKRNNIRAEQCQIFTPTPGTAATVMYATGLNPDNGKPVYVERSERKKRVQKALILYHLRESRGLIEEALKLCGRTSDRAELLAAKSSKSKKKS